MTLVYRVIALVVAVLAGALGGYAAGRMHQRALTAEKRVEVAVETVERHDQVAEVGHAAEVRAVKSVKRVDAWFGGLKQEKPNAKTPDEPVDCRLNPERLRNWEAANAGPEAAAAGEPDDAGRAAAATGQRLAAGSVQQPPGSDAPVLAHEGVLPGPDRVAGEDR